MGDPRFEQVRTLEATFDKLKGLIEQFAQANPELKIDINGVVERPGTDRDNRTMVVNVEVPFGGHGGRAVFFPAKGDMPTYTYANSFNVFEGMYQGFIPGNLANEFSTKWASAHPYNS